MKRKILTVLSILLLATTAAFAVNKAAIWGAYVKYKSSTDIYVTVGSGRCNGTEWEVSSETAVDLTSVLPAGEDFVYIYIDHSASSYPTPVIIGSTTEPVFSDTKIGWYNGDDRCIGVVWVNQSGIIPEFSNNSALKYVVLGSERIKLVLDNGNPSSAWQTLEATDYSPVNTIGIHAITTNTDATSQVSVYVAPYETINMTIRDISYGMASASGWLDIQRGG